MFSHVLVPIDPQFRARRALEVAAKLATEQNAILTLLYVEDLGRIVGFAPFTTLDQLEIDRHQGSVEQFLRDAVAVVAAFDVRVRTQIVRGEAVPDAINHVAASIGADAIVMGTHGRKGLARAWWGSVTEEVLHVATVPVIVVNEAACAAASAPRA